MNREQFLPPAPEVQHLPTLLRRVQAGEIRVPAFQREYVWKEKQIVELLESIYKGYPIGSLLFWQPGTPSIAIKVDAEFPIPRSPDKGQASYILDGQQRLATIYNCFYCKDLLTPDRFNVTFDLRSQTFQHYKQGDSTSGRLHLGSLFAPKAFLELQQALAKEKDAEQLLDSSIALHAAFQEYMIPIVNIRGRAIQDVVKVFERINSTGVRLGAVDFMRAVTWSQDFDLSVEASELQQEAEELGFSIPAETLVKVLAISQDLDPTPESMLTLRDMTAAELRDAIQVVSRGLAGAIQFLQRDLRVFSYEYVPYEAQMLVICKLFMASDLKPSRGALEAVRKWLLRTSITEGLQGKADSVISNLVRSVPGLVTGNARAFEGRMELDPSDLVARKFIVRTALSSALAILLAHLDARSAMTGEAIPAGDYMGEFSANHFVPILSDAEVVSTGLAKQKRILSNMLLVTEVERRALGGTHAAPVIIDRFEKKGGPEVLASQAISQEAVAALKNKRPLEFLTRRAGDILSAVELYLHD